MINQIVVTFVNLFVVLFTALIFARSIMSYFAGPDNRLFGWLVNVTEPVIGPVRRLLPQTPMLDFSPLAAIFLLQGLQWLVWQLLA